MIMVPQFEAFLYPSLLAYKDGKEHNIDSIKTFNVEHLHLTDEDVQELIKSGNRTKVADRTSFAITYLYQAGLITRVKHGWYEISDAGKIQLATDVTCLTRKYLEEKYPAFYEFSRVRKKSAKDSTKTGTETVKSEIEMTPQEQMETAYEIISANLATQLLDEVKNNTPQFFERLVIRLLVAMGYGGSEKDAASVTKYSRDDGIDGVIKEDKLGLDSIYVQAKRYTIGSVQKPDMQKFIGALSEQGASKGIFITTSDFSKGAIETSRKAANVKIVLIDGTHLADYMIQYNIGVSIKQVYEIKKIDSDFFTEE